MTWYITHDNYNGGFSHIFFDIFTSLVFSKLSGIQYLHTNITTNPIRNLPKSTNEDINFDDFFQFHKIYKSRNDINITDYKFIDIYINKYWHCILLKDITNILDKINKYYNKDNNIIFRIKKNNRIFIWQLFHYCNNNLIDKNIWFDLRKTLQNCLNMDRTIEKNVLCVHLRLADCKIDNYNYFKNTMDNVLSNINIKRIYVCSAGLEHQKQEIITNLINNYKKYDITLLFNYDTIETFKIMIKSHILIASQIGTLSKTLGYFSDNIKIYQPLNIKKECLQNKCSPDIFGGWTESYNTNDVILGKFANKWIEANEKGIISNNEKFLTIIKM